MSGPTTLYCTVGLSQTPEARIWTEQVLSSSENGVKVRHPSGIGRWNPRQQAKICYFDTWEQAHQHLTQRANDELEATRRALQVVQGLQGNIKGMKPELQLAAQSS